MKCFSINANIKYDFDDLIIIMINYFIKLTFFTHRILKIKKNDLINI